MNISKHTPGPWVVIERRHPYKDGSKAHIERNIYTEWDHPQLKDKYPIVCTSVGVGMKGEKAIHFAHIDEANARLIAAAPELLEALAGLVGCIDYGSDNPTLKLEAARAAIAKANGEQV